MFYLKYRPQKVSEIDNINIKQQIRRLLNSNNLPHALLFVGQKGTGKTSAARIMAKVLNCKANSFASKSASPEPCNQCNNCLAINKGYSSDVIEMDAASHRGIEEIKSLIKESAFVPMNSRFRVFIIDEAHMITPDGFNALLKTIEEPPKSVIFILATTNPDKIPSTIKSRCLILNFAKAKIPDIVSMLKRISAAEKIKLDDGLLNLIASSADSSFRDAAKILQELVIQDCLSFDKAQSYLGIRGKGNFLEILNKNDLSQTLSWLEEFYQSGGNLRFFIVQIMDDLRRLLLFKSGASNNKETELKFTLKEINLLMKLFHEAYVNLKNSPIEVIPLEVAIVEFYNRVKKLKN